MLCSWPSLPRRCRSDHPGTWKLWQTSKAPGGSMEIVDDSFKIMVWHYLIQYDTIWYDMKWNDMRCYGTIWHVIANNVYIQFGQYTKWVVSNLQVSRLCACFDSIISIVQSVHVTSWTIHSRNILQLNLLPCECKYSGDTRSNVQYVETISNNRTS